MHESDPRDAGNDRVKCWGVPAIQTMALSSEWAYGVVADSQVPVKIPQAILSGGPSGHLRIHEVPHIPQHKQVSGVWWMDHFNFTHSINVYWPYHSPGIGAISWWAKWSLTAYGEQIHSKQRDGDGVFNSTHTSWGLSSDINIGKQNQDGMHIHEMSHIKK